MRWRVRWSRVLGVAAWLGVFGWTYAQDDAPVYVLCGSGVEVESRPEPLAEPANAEPVSPLISARLDRVVRAARVEAEAETELDWEAGLPWHRWRGATRGLSRELTQLRAALAEFKDVEVHSLEYATPRDSGPARLRIGLSILDYDLQRMAQIRRTLKASELAQGRQLRSVRARRIFHSMGCRGCAPDGAFFFIDLVETDPTRRRPLEGRLELNPLCTCIGEQAPDLLSECEPQPSQRLTYAERNTLAWEQKLSSLRELLTDHRDFFAHRIEVLRDGRLRVTFSSLDYDLQRLASFRRALKQSRFAAGRKLISHRAYWLDHCAHSCRVHGHGDSALFLVELVPGEGHEFDLEPGSLEILPPCPSVTVEQWRQATTPRAH